MLLYFEYSHRITSAFLGGYYRWLCRYYFQRIDVLINSFALPSINSTSGINLSPRLTSSHPLIAILLGFSNLCIYYIFLILKAIVWCLSRRASNPSPSKGRTKGCEGRRRRHGGSIIFKPTPDPMRAPYRLFLGVSYIAESSKSPSLLTTMAFEATLCDILGFATRLKGANKRRYSADMLRYCQWAHEEKRGPTSPSVGHGRRWLTRQFNRIPLLW